MANWLKVNTTFNHELRECFICEKKFVNITFHPCEHYIICISCYKSKRLFMLHCPYCGQFVKHADNADFIADKSKQVFFANYGRASGEV